jgi:2-polyprenyl-3-methyl-5-hydroxy-6-metoxy-1,4-benzoquinol methylase
MTQATTDRYFGRDLEAMTFARNYHRWLIDEFSPYLGGSVAEVGAEVGNVSKLILDADIDRLTAFEPSGNMFPILKQRLESEERATVVNGFFGRGIVSDEAFDTILYVNVLEHIEDDASDLTIVQSGIPEAIPVEMCYLGWQQSLEALKRLVEAETGVE